MTRLAWLRGSPHLLAAATARGVAAVWDVRAPASAGPARAFTGHVGMVLDVVAEAEGELWTCGDDGVVRLYSMRA